MSYTKPLTLTIWVSKDRDLQDISNDIYKFTERMDRSKSGKLEKKNFFSTKNFFSIFIIKYTLVKGI